MIWEWEYKAAQGDPMPDGLDIFEQAAYTAMRNIHAAYNAGTLSGDDAAREKQAIAAECKKNQDFTKRLTNHTVAVTMATEGLKREIRQNPSLEAADRLVNVLDGLEHPWIEMGPQEFAKWFAESV